MAANPFREQREARVERPFELEAAGGNVGVSVEPLSDDGPAVATFNSHSGAVERRTPRHRPRHRIVRARVRTVVVMQGAQHDAIEITRLDAAVITGAPVDLAERLERLVAGPSNTPEQRRPPVLQRKTIRGEPRPRRPAPA